MKENLKSLIKEEFKKRLKAQELKDSKFISVGYPFYDETEIYAALECLLDLRLSQGPVVKSFELEIADYMGVKSAVATNSGTSSNLIALNALVNTGNINI